MIKTAISTLLASGFIAGAALAMSTNTSHAQSVPAVAGAAPVAASDLPEALKTKVQAVCNDKAMHLSDKAQGACNSGNFPKVTKAGLFRNAGIGAEFNTLIRQH